MIVPVMAISNLVLTQQIYSEETNGAHAHYREPVPLRMTNVFVKACVLVNVSSCFYSRVTLLSSLLKTALKYSLRLKFG